MKLHIAKEGDTLERLASVYGVPESLLRAANPHAAADGTLDRGSKVKIPFGPVKPAAALTVRVSADAASGEENDEAENALQESAQENEGVAAEAANVPAASEPNANEAAEAAQEAKGQANPQASEKEVWTWSSFVKRSETGQAAGTPSPSAGPAASASTPQINPFASQSNPTPLASQSNPTPLASHSIPLPQALQTNAGQAPQTWNVPQQQPIYYKTEWETSNESPLHAKWTGMNEAQALPPFAQIPTPMVPAAAGMPVSPPYPHMPESAVNTAPGWGGYANQAAWSMMPAAGLPMSGLPGIDPAQLAANGMFAPGPASGMPVPLPVPMPPKYPAAPDCGCGGAPMKAPYAMPLADEKKGKGTARSSSVDDAGEEASKESPAERKSSDTERTERRRARTGKKKASISGDSDPLRKLLGRAAASGRVRTKRSSRPWLND